LLHNEYPVVEMHLLHEDDRLFSLISFEILSIYDLRSYLIFTFWFTKVNAFLWEDHIFRKGLDICM